MSPRPGCAQRLRRLAWVALATGGLLAVGCDLETPLEPDASQDAALGTPGDGATTTPGDAASTPANDASAPDAGRVHDASLADAAVAEAAVTDGATDASPAVTDASFPDAEPATPIGDGGATYTHSGEVVWNVLPRTASAYCPYQSIALWKEETLTLRDQNNWGFYCQSGCPPYAAPPDGEVVFVGGNFDLSVYLIFRPAVLSEFSTESFRKNFLSAKMDWKIVPKTPITYAEGFSGIVTTVWQPPLPEVEFVGYEAPLLHVRLRATGMAQSSVLEQEATLPYACVVQGKFGEFPSICSNVECTYAADTPANGAQFTADLTLPIAPPEP